MGLTGVAMCYNVFDLTYLTESNVFDVVFSCLLKSQSRLVAAAAGAWQRFFVAPGPPKDLWHLWVSLLEALMACAKWGHKLAAMALPTWLSLYFGIC